MYPADGRKVFDVYTAPLGIRSEIKKDLGEFPFRNFWGPAAGIASSRWIAESAKWIEHRYHPDLTLIYLPHLDYNLQKLGPQHSAIATDLEQLDLLIDDLIRCLKERDIKIAIVSEYGITEVDRPIHLNRIFREQGWIAIKDELGLEMIDCGASKVFAVADHQVAHIYMADPSLASSVREIVHAQPGVSKVVGQMHPRSGDFVAIADERSWFTYYYWFDDAVAPDFARTVDIHRKIGYDPVELFINPTIKFPAARVATFLFKKKVGLRGLLSVIPLDATLVRGSHGRIPERVDHRPILMVEGDWEGFADELPATAVYGAIKQLCLAGSAR
jgi:predicted AlkP superfamily pyrophosphatase or phosphodiesterase